MRTALLLALSCALLACASIPEGRSAVDSVHVVNARALDPGEVEEKLATTESHKFMGIARGLFFDYEIFDAAMLQRDLARLERTYRGHGFFEAHAHAARVVHVSPSHVRVEILVDEGPPMLDRQVRVEGLEGLPETIAAAVRKAADDALPRGARFDEDAYAKAKEAVARALTDEGYAYAKVEADAQADLATHTVDYTFSVRAGPRAVYGPITFVRDTEGVKDRGIPIEEAPLRRAMNLQPGEPYSTAAIEAATQAMLDLEVLDAVHIVPDLADPPSPVVPLTVRVQPSKTHAIRLGGGLELDEIKTDVHGLVGWEDHDFFGNLRDFSVDLKPGVVLYPMRVNNVVKPDHLLLEERLRLQLKQPGFLEARTNLSVRPEMNTFPMLVATNPSPDQPVLGYKEPKLSVGLDRRLGKHLLANVAYTIQGELPFYYVTIPDQTPTPIPNVVLSYIQLVTSFDLRDSSLHPHSGIYLANDLSVAGGPLFGDASDVKVQPEARAYVPITHGITLAGRGSVGFLFASNYGAYVQDGLKPPGPNSISRDRFYNVVDRDIEIAFFRGFFSGGPSSNRGYPLRGIAPHGVIPFISPATLSSQQSKGGVACIPGQPGYDPNNCAVSIGGFSLWEASLEVRLEITGPLGAALFCDAGDVAAAPGTLRLDHLHLSCGAGVRYDTPVGPIRLDVGYRIPYLQVLGRGDSNDVFNHDNTEGLPPDLFPRVPIALSFGIGETY